jgi:hypothetical protein
MMLRHPSGELRNTSRSETNSAVTGSAIPAPTCCSSAARAASHARPQWRVYDQSKLVNAMFVLVLVLVLVLDGRLGAVS